MSDYMNALSQLGQSARTTPNEHVESRWMDAYNQGQQNSWRDYYDNYRDAFKRDDPTGYDNNGGYGAILAQYGGSPQNQFYANMMQRQMESVQQNQQKWMDDYLKQQQQGQQQLFQWLQQYMGGGDDPNKPKQPPVTPPGQPGQPPFATTPPGHGGDGNYTIGQNPISRMPFAPPPNMGGGGGGGSTFNPFPGGGGASTNPPRPPSGGGSTSPPRPPSGGGNVSTSPNNPTGDFTMGTQFRPRGGLI